MDTLESKTIRVTFNMNYEIHGEPHHEDEIVEKLNEALDEYVIRSDNASANPRWVMMEQWREIVISGLKRK